MLVKFFIIKIGILVLTKRVPISILKLFRLNIIFPKERTNRYPKIYFIIKGVLIKVNSFMNQLEALQNAQQKGYCIMIKYHNDMNLVAFKDFNQRELNIFFSICSLLKERGEEPVTFSFNDIKSIININIPNNNVFESLLVSTYDKLLQLQLGYHNEQKIVRFSLFTGYVVDKEKKEVTINVNHDYSYILNELSKNFTIFELQEFNSLASSYSKNMFRLLKQYKSTGFYTVSVDEFRRLLDIPESYTMKKIGAKILSLILKELSPYFRDLNINKIKEGRSIKVLEFTFKPQYNKDDQKEIIDTIDVEATQSNLIEENKEQIVCPKCGRELFKRTAKDGSIFWGHKNYLTSDCKATFSTIEDVEAARVKEEAKIKAKEAEVQAIKDHWYYTIQDPKEREAFKKEVKQLIDNHSDIIILIEFTDTYIKIQNKIKHPKFDKLSFNPAFTIPINRDTITKIKKVIDGDI